MLEKNLQDVIDDFKNNGYNFSHIEKMNIITISNKTDTSYDFYIEQNMNMVE